MAELNQVETQLVKGGTVTVIAALREAESGEFFKRTDFDSISYTVERYTPYDRGAYANVEGHTDVSIPLTAFFNSPVVDDLCDDGMAEGYNFRYTLDVSETNAFTNRDATYYVTFSFFPVVGQVTKFQVKVFVQ